MDFGILLLLVISIIVPVNQYLQENQCLCCGEFRTVSLLDKERCRVLDPGGCKETDSYGWEEVSGPYVSERSLGNCFF